MVGLMILQQLNDLTDQEAVRQFAFNLEWHYALDIKGDSDTETYVSDRTLWTMRQLLSEKGLAEELFAKVTEKLVAVFKVDASRQRLDSTHIFSSRSEFLQSDPPLRQCSYRALAGTANNFARECFMDELAAAASLPLLRGSTTSISTRSTPRSFSRKTSTASSPTWRWRTVFWPSPSN